MLGQHDPNLGRRTALGFAIAPMIAAVSWRPALAYVATTTPQAPIERLNNAVLAAMKSGAGTSFDKRDRPLEPVIDQVFDLDAVLATSIGLSWVPIPHAQKTELVAVFCHTVPTQISNSNSCNQQKFEVLPTPRPVGNGKVIAQTQLIRADHALVQLDYVMRKGPAGWQVVDVLTDGWITRMVVRRSGFGALPASGGEPALAAGPEWNLKTLSRRAV